MSIKTFVLTHPKWFAPLFWTKKLLDEYRLSQTTKRRLNTKNNRVKIFYFGIPVHGNLGDLAQGVCIRRWIHKHYSNYQVIEIETNAIVNTHFSVLNRIKKVCQPSDIIIFQSGYTTTDLGGFADEMHKKVIQAFPQNRIIMMPQTIFFKSDIRKKECSDIYNGHRKMLFLARDTVSYKMAKEMFPDIPVECYPDIVTTMIGNFPVNTNRDGIMFCLRDDGEKYYTDKDLERIIEKCSSFAKTSRTDTTKRNSVVSKAEEYIDSEIKKYSRYKVMITDRYHGTILSLAAGTPVIILKTTDHKVVTGADWFKGVYDDYVFVAADLDEAFSLAKEIYNKELTYNLVPYFEKRYYDALPSLFKNKIGDVK